MQVTVGAPGGGTMPVGPASGRPSQRISTPRSAVGGWLIAACSAMLLPMTGEAGSPRFRTVNNPTTVGASVLFTSRVSRRLPATATPLTQAQVDLIAAWIGAGALND